MKVQRSDKWFAAGTLAAVLVIGLAPAASAFPGGRVGGGRLGSRFGSIGGGRYTGERFGGGEGRFGGALEGGDSRGGLGGEGGLREELQSEGGLRGLLGERGSGEGRFGERSQGFGAARGDRDAESAGGLGEEPGASTARSRGNRGQTTGATDDGEGHSYDTRGGGTVDTSKTTSGDTTTRDVQYSGANGQSAEHTGSVTKDDGSFSYSGSGSTGAGGSSNTTASGTYSNGRVTSLNTQIDGQNAAGQTGSHEGNWNRDGDTVSYYGNTQTSTGRDSEAAGWATKTDDGWVAHGAAANDQGAAAGTVVKNGDDVYARSVATNGTTVNRNYMNCQGGDCTRTTVSTTVPPYYPVSVTQYTYYPATYAYYSCPPGSLTVLSGAGGAAVYSCGVTPVVSAVIPLTAILARSAHAHSSGASSPAETAQVTSSPVVMYQVSSDTAVYATSYSPQGLYWEKVRGRSLWVPGAAQGTAEVKRDIERAAEMSAPTANATVITYTIGDGLVYLTNQPPLPGIYSQRAGPLYAWMPGVARPTESQRDTIATAVTAHENGGAEALASQVEKSQQQRPPQSVAAGGQ